MSSFKQHQILLNSSALIAVLLASPVVWADNAPRGDTDDQQENGAASIQPADNLCFGGLEDGKIIVSEPYLQNPYRETTRLGCEVDGGAPVTMPDLPAPDAAKTRLA